MSTEKINLKNLTYKMDKREAARKAAAAYPRHLSNAVRQYMILTGIMEQIPEGWREDPAVFDPIIPIKSHWNIPSHFQSYKILKEEIQIYADADKEMRDNLPGYRLPFHSGEAEQLVFFSMVPNIKMTGYNPSPLLSEVEKEGISEELLEKLKKYFKESADYQGRAKGAEAERDELQGTFDKAKAVYEAKEGKRSDQRNKEVVQILGFSIGKAKPRIDHKEAYFEYVHLIRHKGMSREDATHKIQDYFGYQSRDSTLKKLQECRKNVIEQWKEKSPSVFEDRNLQQYFTGLVLPRR
ncbi:hypothetical protein GKODMF_08495 [Candidatus Electrothrix gigas]